MLTQSSTPSRATPACSPGRASTSRATRFAATFWIPPAGLVRGYEQVKQLDPDRPVVIIQAPLNTVTELTPYRPALDITGADIYPISYPPGTTPTPTNRTSASSAT